MSEVLKFLSSPFGLALAGGLGYAIREAIAHWREEPDRRSDMIDDLQDEIDRLRKRFDTMEQDLREVNVRYFDLATKHLTLHSKHSAVLSAIKYEGSEASRAKVAKVLSAYGESLDDFDADSFPDRLDHPALKVGANPHA